MRPVVGGRKAKGGVRLVRWDTAPTGNDMWLLLLLFSWLRCVSLVDVAVVVINRKTESSRY